MFPILLALAGSCAASSAALLDANKVAMDNRVHAGTVIARYAYAGQGLKGWTSTTFDLATGRFLDEAETPPIGDLHGFDDRTAWLRDLSGAFVPQGNNGRRAVAVSEAYLNAQDWWRKDRGGAQVELIGCDTLKVTPRHGNAFEARFDPTTKLLSSIRQRVTYGMSTETRFFDYRRRAGLTVPSRIETITNDDPATTETMRLRSFQVATAKPSSAFSMPTSKPSDGSLPKSGQVTVPFKLLNNHVIVEAKVNGKGPFPFLLDTGGHDIVTPATLTALSLSSKGKTASGGGGEGLATNGYVRVQSLDLGGARLTDQTVVTLDFSPYAVEGIHLGGMLGLEFMERFIVRIDYGRRTVTIMNRKRFDTAERKRSGAAIPFSFYEHMPQIEGEFDGRPARFDIDTGSRSDVSMTSPYVEREHLRAAYPKGVVATAGWGVGGPSRSYIVRAHSMKLGSVTVPRPIADLSVAKKGALSDSTYDGNVGSGALKRFTVTFDYADRTIYLTPTTRLDADTSQFDRAGMWLNLAEGGLRVMDITPGGPAEAAGLRVGDVITDIGGSAVVGAGQSLSQARSSLKTAQVGQPVTVAYRREGQPATTHLTPSLLIPN